MKTDSLKKISSRENASIILEQAQCAICGLADHEFLFQGKDKLYGLPGEFQLVLCKQCGLVYLNPRPNTRSMGFYYPEQYGPHQEVDPEFLREVDRKVSLLKRGVGRKRRSLELFENRGLFPVPEGGKILDLGCGSGAFLYLARKLGWDAYGVEISARAARYAREMLNLNVFIGNLEEARFPDGFFDFVNIYHVLEHLAEPASTLREIARITKESGQVVITVPNIQSLGAKLFREKWFGLDVPRHLYNYSPTTIQQLLKRVKEISITEIRYRKNITALDGSLRYAIGPNSFLLRMLDLKTTRMVLRMLMQLLALLRLSDEIGVYCKIHHDRDQSPEGNK